MNVFDILLDEDFDLVVKNGDLVVGESTLQHQALLLLSNKGDWRQSPTVGMGLNNYLLEDAPADVMRQAIRQELERDGMQVGSIDVAEGALPEIQASYE